MDEKERIRDMMFNLTGTALNWYGTEIATSNKLTWVEVKTKMVQRWYVWSIEISTALGGAKNVLKA